MKKLIELLEKLGLSPKEIHFIIKVSLISVICSFLTVGGAWIYSYFKAHPQVIKHQAKKKVLEEPDHSRSSYSESSPLDIEAHKLTAESLIKRGKPNEALPFLKRAFLLSNQDPSIGFTLAVALLEAGFFEDALHYLQNIESIELPESIATLLCIKTGMTHFYLGDISLSTEKLNDCLKNHPESPEILSFLGQIEIHKGTDLQKARHYLEQAVQIDSHSVESYYQLGRFEMTTGDTLQARKHLLAALELDPLHVKSHARLGMLYYYMGNTDLAVNGYRTALALNPTDFNTRYNLGELLYTTGDTVSALKEFTQTLQESPSHVDANFRVGLISVRNGMTKEAIGYFETALEKDPSNIRIRLQLAVAFEKVGLIPDAIATYQRILEIDELNPIAQQKIKMLSKMGVE